LLAVVVPSFLSRSTLWSAPARLSLPGALPIFCGAAASARAAAARPSHARAVALGVLVLVVGAGELRAAARSRDWRDEHAEGHGSDRESPRLTPGHPILPYAVFCLEKNTHMDAT